MKTIWIEKLKKQGACPKAIDWASEYDSAQAAWDACERGDWMLWAWGRNCGAQGSKSHRRLVIACAEIAKTSLKYIKEKELNELVKKSLKTTERWVKGEKSVTLDNVRNAAAVANYAAVWANYTAVWAAGAAREKKCADIIRKIQPLCPKFKKMVTE